MTSVNSSQKIREKIKHKAGKNSYTLGDSQVNYILTVFKEEIEKMKNEVKADPWAVGMNTEIASHIIDWFSALQKEILK